MGSSLIFVHLLFQAQDISRWEITEAHGHALCTWNICNNGELTNGKIICW